MGIKEKQELENMGKVETGSAETEKAVTEKVETEKVETEKVETEKVETEKAEKPKAKKNQKFTKNQIVTSRKYAKRRDILMATLTDGEAYSHAEVEAKITEFLGKKR
ncbi:MAG: hypothetical protein R3Y53_11340 [Bacillota bacterium]